VVLGSQEFLRRLRRGQFSDEREKGMRQRLAAARPDFASVGWQRGEGEGREMGGVQPAARRRGRDLALYLGRKEGGMKLEELARAAGMKGDASVAVVLRR